MKNECNRMMKEIRMLGAEAFLLSLGVDEFSSLLLRHSFLTALRLGSAH